MAYTPKSWSNGMVIDASDLNKIEQGVAAKAEKGDKGDAGKNGVTPNITMTASKLPAGQNPTVTKGGTAEAPTFALGIPDGAKGDKGDAGAKGADGKSVKAITLTTNSEGKVTGGTCTLSDNSTINITVSVASA